MSSNIALVTGANKGIGYATVKALLKLGHTVILTSRDEAKGKLAVKELNPLGQLHYHQLDVADQQSIDHLYQWVKEEFGKLDVLINNAGINYDTWHGVLNARLDEVQQTMDTNLMGAWRMCQAFVPLMQQHGYGRIVNVSSGAGSFREMGGGTPAYSISKAAMNVLTLKLAHTILGANILVNSVCPGWVRTDMGGSGAPRSPEKGAETIIWAATLEDQKQNGKFFRDKREINW